MVREESTWILLLVGHAPRGGWAHRVSPELCGRTRSFRRLIPRAYAPPGFGLSPGRERRGIPIRLVRHFSSRRELGACKPGVEACAKFALAIRSGSRRTKNIGMVQPLHTVWNILRCRRRRAATM